jgi:hypothetical protein
MERQPVLHCQLARRVAGRRASSAVRHFLFSITTSAMVHDNNVCVKWCHAIWTLLDCVVRLAHKGRVVNDREVSLGRAQVTVSKVTLDVANWNTLEHLIRRITFAEIVENVCTRLGTAKRVRFFAGLGS